ncbi:unnamed protein product [Linum trigynum]|uniref:Uncharacterized protein n=1 Tax=Linum trigynum TaxID=586398 RepID=A0AAV2GFC9_9ROSI
MYEIIHASDVVSYSDVVSSSSYHYLNQTSKLQKKPYRMYKIIHASDVGLLFCVLFIFQVKYKFVMSLLNLVLDSAVAFLMEFMSFKSKVMETCSFICMIVASSG